METLTLEQKVDILFCREKRRILKEINGHLIIFLNTRNNVIIEYDKTLLPLIKEMENDDEFCSELEYIIKDDELCIRFITDFQLESVKADNEERENEFKYFRFEPASKQNIFKIVNYLLPGECFVFPGNWNHDDIKEAVSTFNSDTSKYMFESISDNGESRVLRIK